MAPRRARPSPVEMYVASWKVTRLRPTHGPSTTTTASIPRARAPSRRRRVSVRAASTAGTSSAGTNRMSSARTRASAPHATPMRAARPSEGDRSKRTMHSRITAMNSMDGVSDMRMPLGIQKLGANAATSAAVSPTHGPATARPSNPTNRTTRAPSTGMDRLWTVAPKGFATISKDPISGG